jgi:hypothetical protein
MLRASNVLAGSQAAGGVIAKISNLIAATRQAHRSRSETMALRKLSVSILLTAGTTALMVGLTAAPAFAATWTVKPGGAITAKTTKTTLKDTKTGNSLTCTSSTAKATLKKGSGLSGTAIGSITSVTFGGCSGPLGLTFTVKTSHLPWKLNATSYASGVTHGTITGIHATLTGPSCSATVDGTSATANNGKVSVTYTNSSGALKVLTTGGNLHIYKVSGCAGLIGSGDASTFSATYTVTPKQTITSP